MLRVLTIGYAMGAATAGAMALALAAPGGRIAFLVVVFAMAAVHVAVQEALESARAAELVAPGARGIAFGALGAVNRFGRLASSTSIGLLWTAVSPTAAFAAARREAREAEHVQEEVGGDPDSGFDAGPSRRLPNQGPSHAAYGSSVARRGQPHARRPDRFSRGLRLESERSP